MPQIRHNFFEYVCIVAFYCNHRIQFSIFKHISMLKMKVLSKWKLYNNKIKVWHALQQNLLFYIWSHITCACISENGELVRDKIIPEISYGYENISTNAHHRIFPTARSLQRIKSNPAYLLGAWYDFCERN